MNAGVMLYSQSCENMEDFGAITGGPLHKAAV